MADDLLRLLCNSQKIERDRGIVELQRHLSSVNDSSLRYLENEIQSTIGDPSVTWESRHGALMAAKALVLEHRNPCSDEFVNSASEFVLRFLEDPESRVRLVAGEVLGALCEREGPHVYVVSRDSILAGVRENLQRQPINEASHSEQAEADKLMGKLTAPNKRSSVDAEQIFHDTAGWKSLETWMKCLESVIDGCGPTFNAYIDQDLLDVIFTCVTHANRFVRETGYYVCAALVGCNYDEEEGLANLSEDNAIYQHGHLFANQLAQGLADNWSQVRLAASVATRKFLMSLVLDEIRQKFYPALLPPLCLNRYYVAEGVRIYNQETWRQVTGGDGRHLVESHIKQVVEFYISQTEADNHAVREAACACIAELGSKIGKEVVRSYVGKLLDALIVCFKDQSWPVRDASCVACGNFVVCFPEESRPAMVELYSLFYENLQDNIPSVRQGAAIALANVVRAYGEEAAAVILQKVREGLEGVERQSENAEKYGGLEKGPATYGVVKRARDNDMELHTDKQMYSCGSLAPKMHRGKRDGGCMDHNFRRPPEAWEMADGCIHLVAELSQMPEMAARVSEQLPMLATAAGYRHYTQHVHLLETVCKQLPVVARGVGKRQFKPHLDAFFDSVFYSLTCDNALTSSAASQCLNKLSMLIGPNILRGRVEQYAPRYLEHLDANQFIAPL